MKTKQQRIINKILMNQTGIVEDYYQNQNKVKQVTLTMKYKKYKKELLDIFELLAFCEQFSGQKTIINPKDIVEKNYIVKLNEQQLSVKLQKKRAIDFLQSFQLILLGERKYFNLKEKNCLNITDNQIHFRYKMLKIFRRYLITIHKNLEANLQITVNYRKYAQTNPIHKYWFYILRKNDYFIK